MEQSQFVLKAILINYLHGYDKLFASARPGRSDGLLEAVWNKPIPGPTGTAWVQGAGNLRASARPGRSDALLKAAGTNPFPGQRPDRPVRWPP